MPGLRCARRYGLPLSNRPNAVRAITIAAFFS
jgi:hypothetical protein